MNNQEFRGKSLSQWKDEFPIINDICSLKETAWLNPAKTCVEEAVKMSPLTMDDVLEASARLDRFADYFKAVFPETRANNGILESPVQAIPNMQSLLNDVYGCNIDGHMWAKLDSSLPISGSIKARGGIYEVLKTAESIAMENGMLHEGDNYSCLARDEFRELFSKYSIAVGSTGNLGLSIGIMSAKLGFKVTVHMSADARQWKKDLLRSKGVTVIEYESDYSVAVAQGREQVKDDPYSNFVDDENSKTLFLGYAVAALRLKKQFEEKGIQVDSEHPLFVYLPCGVGGGPGGVAFGIKLVFGDAAHCFFAEPTHSCCMMLGLATGLDSDICVQDLGIDNLTIADGLAVGRASSFVGSVIRPFLSGSYSLEDDRMYKMLAQLTDTENIRLEPSALAGMYGPVLLSKDAEMSQYPAREGISKVAMANATQLIWCTGGSMVPAEEMEKYYNKGKKLLK